MYIKAHQYEKAALLYTKHLIKADKSRISEATALLEKVSNDALNSAFGKACLSAGRYEDALRAFQRAHDYDKVVEIYLRHLDQVQKAFDLVRGAAASAQAAQLVAEYCIEQKDHRGAIEFLLTANKSDEAFLLAQSNNIMDVYCTALGAAMSPEEAVKVAHYYEKAQDWGRAGKYYALCGQYPRALKLFLLCGDREIDAAIEVVGKSQSEGLTHQLIDYLMGEKDGVPKDPNYIYRLYLALKKYDEAAKTAMVIARQEQDLGNFPAAHAVLAETIRQLEDCQMKVPLLMRQSFVLLHSHHLAKGSVQRQDHLTAARLLLRVAQNVSKFPSRIVPILTATVIECQLAGLKASSYEYAVMLVRPEFRSLLDVNLKRKIEAIVRRRGQQGEDLPEELTPCPVSSQLIPAMALECPTTKEALPMCVITGQHLLLDDWCFCPASRFPASYSAYIRYLQETHRRGQGLGGGESKGEGLMGNSNEIVGPDPVWGKPVALKDLVRATEEEAMAYIRKYNNIMDTASTSEGDGREGGGEDEGVEGEGGAGGAGEGDGDGRDKATGEGGKSRSRGGGGGGGKGKGGLPPSRHARHARAKLERMQRSKKKKDTPSGGK